MDSNGNCNGYKFWEQNHSGSGWCHRYPPRDDVDRCHGDEWTGFVRTSCEDWCGEYEPSEFQKECEAGVYDEEIEAARGAPVASEPGPE